MMRSAALALKTETMSNDVTQRRRALKSRDTSSLQCRWWRGGIHTLCCCLSCPLVIDDKSSWVRSSCGVGVNSCLTAYTNTTSLLLCCHGDGRGPELITLEPVQGSYSEEPANYLLSTAIWPEWYILWLALSQRKKPLMKEPNSQSQPNQRP